MEKQEVKNLLKLAIQNMLDADAKTGPAKKLLLTSERNITAHLRNHVAKIILYSKIKYQVDHEYHRIGLVEQRGYKKMPDEKTGKLKGIIPDIAVHLRGITAKQNKQANKLVIETKLIPIFDGFVEHIINKQTNKRLEYDIKKLKFLRDRKGKFKYQNTACVVFSKSNGDKIWISIDGNSFEVLQMRTTDWNN